MIDKVEFDTIYHEHLCYYLADRARAGSSGPHGLAVVDVERLAIHGGSLRYTLSRPGENRAGVGRVDALLAEERGWGVEARPPIAPSRQGRGAAGGAPAISRGR